MPPAPEGLHRPWAPGKASGALWSHSWGRIQPFSRTIPPFPTAQSLCIPPQTEALSMRHGRCPGRWGMMDPLRAGLPERSARLCPAALPSSPAAAFPFQVQTSLDRQHPFLYARPCDPNKCPRDEFLH